MSKQQLLAALAPLRDTDEVVINMHFDVDEDDLVRGYVEAEHAPIADTRQTLRGLALVIDA